jgi:hypothetical protein
MANRPEGRTEHLPAAKTGNEGRQITEHIVHRDRNGYSVDCYFINNIFSAKKKEMILI